jgi:hypothetical protein
MFVDHEALAPLSNRYPAWSFFPAVRDEQTGNWSRTWAGAATSGGILGGPIAEFQTVTADTPPDRPCETIDVFYTPTPSMAYAVRRDRPPYSEVGPDATGAPVYAMEPWYRSGMGAVQAERLVDCDECPPHPADTDEPPTRDRHAWMRVWLTINGVQMEFDAKPSDCASLVACCNTGSCLFLNGCGNPNPSDPLTGLCATDPVSGCTWSNNRRVSWEFCGWQGITWWQGTVFLWPAQCQIDLPGTDTWVGGEFEISWSGWTMENPSAFTGSSGDALGFGDNCSCSDLHDDRYPDIEPECKFTEGDQWGYPYIGDQPCRPHYAAPLRNTADDTAECWGLYPPGSTNGCTGGPMDNYTVDWIIAP